MKCGVLILEDYSNGLSINSNNQDKGNLCIMSINIGDSIENRLDAILDLLDTYSPNILFIVEVHSYNECVHLLTNTFRRKDYLLYINCTPKPTGDIYNFARSKKRPIKGGVVAVVKNSEAIFSVFNMEERSGIRLEMKWNEME